uniref:ABC transporter permease n=2 Tax=cellular organisms TaxID=131567 RepID=A0A7J3TG88_9EURY
MLRYIVKRLAIAVFVIFGTSALTFFLLSLTPGDTAVIIIKRAFVGDIEYNPSIVEVKATKDLLGLGNPLYIQYLQWLINALHGDFGRSYVTGRPVLDEILPRLNATIELAIVAAAFSLLVAIPLGVVSAVRQNSGIDYLSMAIATFFVAMPNFWVALILILIFSLYLDLLPATGYGGIEHLILPVITLGAGMAAITMRLTRSSVLEVLRLDYVRTARAKGLDERRIILRHVLKNAMIPVITVVGLQLAHLLAGTVIVETIFAWPGIGKLLIDSVNARDIPVIQGCVFFIAIIVSLVTLITDVIYRFLDPRIKYE